METELTLSGHIENKILWIREQKVILNIHLSSLYGVENRVLIQSVKRNIERFPEDFMFQLTMDEVENLKSQFVISSFGKHGGRRSLPYAFTEQGVAMLSGVLRSKQAITVNIEIMRAFVNLRRLLNSNEKLKQQIEELEQKYDEQFSVVFKTIRQLMTPPEPKSKRPIGFAPWSEEKET